MAALSSSVMATRSMVLMGISVCTGLFLLRVGVSLHSYSGAGKPPLYGDFEAQRHWMEITYHLQPSSWYMNSSVNDLQYWGLDYPPLTAYHSWLCGYISHQINPEWVALEHSRGFESYDHKLFMRYSVLIGDFLVYFPAILLFVYVLYQDMSVCDKLSTVSLILLSSSLVLIDHGHFQYNSISLGLFVWAITASVTKRYLICCVMFVLALNFKQMELYHAVPFFCFLLGRACQKEKWYIEVLKYGMCVIATFVVCWLPFITSLSQTLQVLHRLFPFARGIYEDKVASFWCSISVLIKLKSILSTGTLAQVSLAVTLLSLLPSAINLVMNPSPYRFLLSLVNCALSFFLFSFQVHEKSILLVIVPVTLLSPVHPVASVWFNVVATLSMYPLLIKDGLILPMWAVLGVFCLCFHLFPPSSRPSTTNSTPYSIIMKILFSVSIVSLVALCLCSHLVTPPPRYPDIFPVLISGMSCVNFIGFLVFFNFTQLRHYSHTTYQTTMKMPVL